MPDLGYPAPPRPGTSGDVRPRQTRSRGDPLAVSSWLRKRGKASRPELTRTQRAELAECFALIDEDGSGAIDHSELEEAFKVGNRRHDRTWTRTQTTRRRCLGSLDAGRGERFACEPGNRRRPPSE